jgi:hypothetical protein
MSEYSGILFTLHAAKGISGGGMSGTTSHAPGDDPTEQNVGKDAALSFADRDQYGSSLIRLVQPSARGRVDSTKEWVTIKYRNTCSTPCSSMSGEVTEWPERRTRRRVSPFASVHAPLRAPWQSDGVRMESPPLTVPSLKGHPHSNWP